MAVLSSLSAREVFVSTGRSSAAEKAREGAEHLDAPEVKTVRTALRSTRWHGGRNPAVLRVRAVHVHPSR